MGEVSITIGSRSFKLGCDDGEEQHLTVLAEHLGKHVENLRTSLGKTGDEQLYLMAGLMICDELWDTRKELAKLEQKLAARVVPPEKVTVMPPRMQAGAGVTHGKPASVQTRKMPDQKPVGAPMGVPRPKRAP